MRKIVTPEDREKMVALYREGKTTVQIAALTGWSQPNVSRQLRLLKEPNRATREKEGIIELYKQGVNASEIGRRLNRVCGTITRVLKQAGIDIRPKPPVYTVNERFFDDPMSWKEGQAYWFGWLATDGTNNKVGTGFGICIAEQDRSVLECLARLIDYTGPIRTAPRHQKVAFIAGRPVSMDRQQDRSQLFIYNRNLSTTLRTLGIRSGKGGDFIPPPINPEVYKHYVRASFEGDGCFSFSRQNKWEANLIGSPIMLDEIGQWLKSHGIHSHIGNKGKSPFGNGAKILRVCGNNTGMRLFRLLYPGSKYFLPRKMTAFIKLYRYKRQCLIKHFEREQFALFEKDILPYAS